MAELLAQGIAKRPGDIIAEYELALEASRRPEMRELSHAWHNQVAAQVQAIMTRVGSTSPVEDTYLILMAMTGMELDSVTRGAHGPDAEQLRSRLARLLGALLKAPAPRD